MINSTLIFRLSSRQLLRKMRLPSYVSLLISTFYNWRGKFKSNGKLLPFQSETVCIWKEFAFNLHFKKENRPIWEAVPNLRKNRKQGLKKLNWNAFSTSWKKEKKVLGCMHGKLLVELNRMLITFVFKIFAS